MLEDLNNCYNIYTWVFLYFSHLLNLCGSPFVQHINLLTLGNQKILEGLEVVDKEVRTKKKTRGQPIVDANDVASCSSP